MAIQSGSYAPDGSAVELYALLPPGDEPDLISDTVGHEADILELGCGAGRVTHELVRRGHRVVAVDQWADMLARVRGTRTVLGDIESVDLKRSFDTVVLASHLVNTTDAMQRRAFLSTCRRHVRKNGCVLIQRHELEFVSNALSAGSRRLGDVTISLQEVRVAGALVSATAVYQGNGRTWLHPFETTVLSDEEIRKELESARLELRRFLDPKRTWIEARPWLADGRKD